jgi:hypothetical protein
MQFDRPLRRSDAMTNPPVIRADLLAAEWTDIVDALSFKALAHDSWGIYGPVIHGSLQHEEDPEATAKRLYALAGRMDDLR